MFQKSSQEHFKSEWTLTVRYKEYLRHRINLHASSELKKKKIPTILFLNSTVVRFATVAPTELLGRAN